MPVHNALPYLDAAIESILSQTFREFEFVILDDGSTDGSGDRLREWTRRDGRIRVLHAKKNLGPVLSSQRVATQAKAPIVARMDADDLSYPDRFKDQLDVLEAYPDAGLVACLCDTIDAAGRRIRGPETWRLLRSSPMVPFAHGAIMYRRAIFDQVGGYRKQCEYWEDQDLITRIAAASAVMVIPRALYAVRQTATSTRTASKQERLEHAIDGMYRAMAAGGAKDPAETKLDPRVFLSLGSASLWAGKRPRLFTRLARHGRLGANKATAAALIWTGWASVSPGTLRAFLRMLLKLRNRKASALPSEVPVRWSPPEGA